MPPPLYCFFALIPVLIFPTNNHFVIAARCTKTKCSSNNNEDTGNQNCGTRPDSCPKDSRYRSYDGSCNNLENPSWGTPLSPYGHFVQNNYYDGVSTWPTASDGSPLPNAREISLKIFVPKHVDEHRLNLNTMQWGQVIAHDMSLTAGTSQLNVTSPVCCNMKGKLAPDATISPFCHPVDIPDIDTVHKSEGKECLNFIRTVSTKDRGCTKPDAPAYPLSVVTSYMDLSLTYGSTEALAKSLREGTGGRLLTTIRNDYEWPPQVGNATQVCNGASSPNETCFNFGDIRGNQSPHLAILQIILLYEHNRVADILYKLNPHWDDETIYQEARRICIAEIQYINYYEYLPGLLGTDNMVEKKLIYLDTHKYVNDYDCSVNPAVYKEHATAAFRHFHTMIQGYLDLLTENREFAYKVRISDWFNKPSILDKDDAFDDLTRGMTYQAADKSDQYWTLETTRYLFRGNQSTGGDLRATDIQRSRDHGLGTYTELREFCGLRVLKSFDDLKEIMSSKNVEILKSLYKSPADIDLAVGGALEYHAPGALVGPTFLCILLKQFLITRTGDRFFFENGCDDELSFTLPQLNTIRDSASMARLLCDNGHNIKWMQPKAFELVSDENPLVRCNKLRAVDLSLWKETEGNNKTKGKLSFRPNLMLNI